MRGLAQWPSTDEFALALHLLETKRPTTTQRIALLSQWGRIEPRIAESLCRYLTDQWTRLDPLILNQELRDQPWPAALGVLLEFLSAYLPPKEKKKFQLWYQLVMSDIPAANHEQFFIGLRKFAGKEMFKDATMSLRPYTTWGYLSRENLMKSQMSPNRCLYDQSIREKIFRDFLGKKKSFTISDYRNAFQNQISKRQAERDLASMKSVTGVGQTRARVYILIR